MELLAKDQSLIENIMYPSKGKRVLYMGNPVPIDLDKIKTVTKNMDWDPEEWFVFPLRISDNFLSRSNRVWHDEILNQFAKDMVGKPLLYNHDWDSPDESVGIVFDSFASADSPSDEIISSGNRKKSNYNILNKKGYKCVYALAAIHASKQNDIMSVKTMRIDKCSTGGILSEVDVICPHCSEEYGREVSFFEIDENSNYICPHEMPGGYEYEEDSLVADYAIWTGNMESVELSLVVCGNLPGASVMR